MVDLTSPAQLSQIFRKHNFRPKKRFGQNFLVDRNILEKILDAAGICKGDSVLEIGPGAGTLTQAALLRGARVAAVEIDRDIIAILEEALAPYPNATIVNADFLSINVPNFLQEHFGDVKVKVLGNLPYYITSPIISRLLQAKDRIDSVVMMVQKEVAVRLKAAPGTSDYGSMSVFVQYYAEPEIVSYVSKNVFMPPPEVSSAVVKLTPRPAPPVLAPSEEVFFNIVHCAFGKRRKTLLNSLSDCPAMGFSKERVGQVLRAAGIDAARRAETLSLEEFARIARSII
ncbi:MAG: 16S rRNA (adenine(1518)-N(6)/adenine(1519)-N(6))-dimethyltransferase RsmA [Armatimonadota bacterium]|jgi:16S rRNA (adenine1518-N6/adenine1519-N6)-dimethyltransferase|nr:16S rRNA (adenine(1518)-N(6)/adenine(1519)-N(6))-dimethyltransferase [Armatimonadota bacterium]